MFEHKLNSEYVQNLKQYLNKFCSRNELKKGTIRYFKVVARERFELSSEAPEASMLDRYTTGLRKRQF